MARPPVPKGPKHEGATDAVAILRRRFEARGGKNVTLNLNMVPMIDVTFLLIIFFAVTTTFKRAEGLLTAKLPAGNAGGSAVAAPLPVHPVVIRLQQSGDGPGDYRIVIEQFVNHPATFGELTEFLRGIQGNPGFSAETPVVIAAESEVNWDHVVNCWNAALRAGCRNIAFGRQ
jgi:biopolymer transport protein ExbD